MTVPNPRVLFIGGTGLISSACVAEAISLGFDVTVLNRGKTAWRPLAAGITQLCVDLDDDQAMIRALDGLSFHVVADFMSYTPPRLERNISILQGRVNQYIFISSASAYHKPVLSWPITESTPVRNDYWQYSRDKIACEEYLTTLWRRDHFPMTIVRPSHTYDGFSMPLFGGWTQISRAREGKPIVIPGDGTSLWTLTHSSDFAYMFAGVLANPQAIGEVYQIMGDEVLTWDAITRMLAEAAGVPSLDLIHIASETIARILPDEGPGLLGDKAHSVFFDSSKVRRLRPGFAQKVPFWRGAQEIIATHDAHGELTRPDEVMEAGLDKLTSWYRG